MALILGQTEAHLSVPRLGEGLVNNIAARSVKKLQVRDEESGGYEGA